MNGSWSRVKRALILLALVGSTFSASGCNYALNANYETLYQQIGDAAIAAIAKGVLADASEDFNTIIGTPSTTFAQSWWNNFVASRIPNDVELK